MLVVVMVVLVVMVLTGTEQSSEMLDQYMQYNMRRSSLQLAVHVGGGRTCFAIVVVILKTVRLAYGVSQPGFAPRRCARQYGEPVGHI